MRRLGVDYGERRIGLAVSDDEGRMALPLETVEHRGGGGIDVVARRARERAVEAIVVGLPLMMNGREGTSARRARAFGDALARRTGLPVVFWDERWTTAAAERSLSEAGIRGARRRRVVDQSAAALLLQSYLDAPVAGADGPDADRE